MRSKAHGREDGGRGNVCGPIGEAHADVPSDVGHVLDDVSRFDTATAIGDAAPVGLQAHVDVAVLHLGHLATGDEGR